MEVTVVNDLNKLSSQELGEKIRQMKDKIRKIYSWNIVNSVLPHNMSETKLKVNYLALVRDNNR